MNRATLLESEWSINITLSICSVYAYIAQRWADDFFLEQLRLLVPKTGVGHEFASAYDPESKPRVHILF